MDLKDFTGKPCSSRSAYEFIPRQKRSLDLAGVAIELRGAGFELDAETRFVLLFRALGKELSLFKSGKIIVKQTNSEEEARKVAKKVAEMLG